jgi:signal transduction histidine kinase
MLRFLGTHLAWKVFISYLIVILVGMIVLLTTSNLSVPFSFDQHFGSLNLSATGSSQASRLSPFGLVLFDGYQAAVRQTILWATLASFIAAVIAAYFISRQVVRPVLLMLKASQRVAEGEYRERLNIPGIPHRKQLDELNQLALSFNKMAEKLEKTEAMRLQLIGDVSHELRTPLTVIKGSMEGLIDGVLPARNETYQQIYAEADRLQRLVNDLQELSRIEAGAFSIELRPVQVSNLIEKVLSQLVQQFKAKNLEIETYLPPGAVEVLADEDRIFQVLTNLVGNALQYSLPGGKISITASVKPGAVEISIADTGIGISPEHIQHVFERFYRADKSRARASGGSGIGLTIAKVLVNAHQGSIWVESAGEGKGSTFHFTLPRAT